MFLSGCAIIAGTEEAGNLIPAFPLQFVETLRSQESLRGGSFKEVAPGAAAEVSSLQRPASVYADPYRVYVTDLYLNPPLIPSPRVFIFDRGAQSVSALLVAPPPGSVSGEGRLLAPSGIAVGAGVIFVSDFHQGRVFAYDLNGMLLKVLGVHGAVNQNGSGGVLSSPSAVAVDNFRNRLYVADSGSHQVKVFEGLDRHVFDIGNGGRTAGEFKFPSALSVDRDGSIYVVDGLKLRVHVFDPDGRLMNMFSMKNALQGRTIKPTGIAVDSDGHVYIADAANNTILIFDQDGELIYTWGRTGSLIGDFWTPTGIFIDDRDFIYVADQTNGRIQTFRYIK